MWDSFLEKAFVPYFGLNIKIDIKSLFWSYIYCESLKNLTKNYPYFVLIRGQISLKSPK